MADFVSGIKPISPTYPLRPAQPAQKDRQPGGRRKKPATGNSGKPEGKTERDPATGDDRQPTIDEHV